MGTDKGDVSGMNKGHLGLVQLGACMSILSQRTLFFCSQGAGYCGEVRRGEQTRMVIPTHLECIEVV